MLFRNHRPILVLIIAFAFLIILARYSYFASIVIHTLVDVFAGGRSSVKVDLFFVYVILLSTIALVLGKGEILSQLKIRNFWVLLSVLATFTYSTALMIVFYRHWGLDISDFVVVLHNGEVTSTMLLHNHIMKGFNGWVLHWFGMAGQENLDAGYSLLHLLPNTYYLVGGVFFAVAAVFLILKFVELYKKQQGHNLLFIVLYSTVSFSLLKNMLDGGVLNRETPLALAGLCFILLWTTPAKFKDIYKVLAWSFSPLAVYLGVILILWQAKLIAIYIFTATIFPMILFVVLLLTLAWWWVMGFNAKSRVGAVLLLCSIVSFYFPISNSVETYLGSRRVLSSEGAFVALYKNPEVQPAQQSTWVAQEQFNNLTVYQFLPIQPARINEVLTSNNLVPNYKPITIPGYNCLPVLGTRSLSFTVSSPNQMNTSPTTGRFGRLSMIKELPKVNKLYQYRVTVDFSACTPRILNIVQELLRSQGREPFFITNTFQGGDDFN